MHNDILLSVANLSKHFPVRSGVFGRPAGAVRAVQDVSFEIRRGETLALVGESGCGKTTTGRCILRLLEPSAGTVLFDGTNLQEVDKNALRTLRRRMQIVFQDPFSSLNPRMRIGRAIGEGLVIHGIAEGEAAAKRVRQLLDEVGLRPEYASRYPHEFSGGQRQRVGIARALSVEPDFIVCDEPVSALDVSVQAQVINLLVDLQKQRGLTYLFIAHDLSVVRHMATRVAVMYLGRIVELADATNIYDNPQHPYTQALLSAVPRTDPDAGGDRIILEGDVPSPANPPPGCVFYPRCQHPAKDGDCIKAPPPLAERSGTHLAACIKEPLTAPR
jgi:oligopeptide/dipeptide ABC transporter ATP-binding protein